MVGWEPAEPNACGHCVRRMVTYIVASAVVVEARNSVTCYRVVHLACGEHVKAFY